MRSRRQKRSSRRHRGFTLIEVLMSMAVMTVGAVGIMSMQQASTRGNMESRQIYTASEVARNWIERIRRDALMWNRPVDSVTDLDALVPTSYLDQLPIPGNLNPTAWMEPAGAQSFGADYYGLDTAAGGTSRPYFCTNVRLAWAVPRQAIRVDVRTWWHHRGSNRDAANLDVACGTPGAVSAALSESGATGTPPADVRIGAVYVSAVVRWQPTTL